MLSMLDKASKHGLDTTNFKEIGIYIENILGKERFSTIYPRLKGLYNSLGIAPEVNETYEELFLTDKEKNTLLDNDKLIIESALPQEVFNMSETYLQEELDLNTKQYLKDQGFTVFKK